ncbi:MAG: ABC transporter substrate-binding protein [Anaerolineales bacterium]
MRQKLFLSVVFIALLFSACAPAQANQHVLRFGWVGGPETYHPGLAELSETFSLMRLVYDTLYEYNLDGTFSLELAESVTVSDDGLVWTYKIRDGVKWHDGKPLTADDIVFTYRFYTAHQEFPYLPGYLSVLEDVRALPGNILELTLVSPISNLDALLFDLPILPAHIWSVLSFEEASTYENAAMVGSGPFRFVGREGNVIRLEVFREHYLYKPEIDVLEFVSFDDEVQMVEALEKGEIDAVYQLSVSLVERLENAPNIQVVTGAPAAPSVSDILINQISENDCPLGSVCSGHPALRDRNVRLALAHATNKAEIIDKVMRGLGTPGLTLIPDGLGDFYNDQIKDYAYDVALANQILDDFGYRDINGDGVREMPGGGRPLIFRIAWDSDSPVGRPQSELLKAMWAQIGIDVTFEPKSPDELSAVCCPAFDYDLILWAWGSDPDPDFLLSVPTSSGIETGLNETGYSNPIYDALYEQQEIEPDHEKRRAIIWQMQEILHRDVVYIIPYYDVQIQAFRTDKYTGWRTNDPLLSLERLANLTSLKPIR